MPLQLIFMFDDNSGISFSSVESEPISVAWVVWDIAIESNDVKLIWVVFIEE